MSDTTPAEQIALTLIKQFEGCHLDSYVLDGEHQATIGWGTAIPLAQHPRKITQAQADEWLLDGVRHREAALRDHEIGAVWDKLSDNQKGAVLCFRYNLTDSQWTPETCNTRQALKRGDLKGYILRSQTWINRGTKFEAGLRRRRRCEQFIFNGGTIEQLRAKKWFS